MSAIVKEMSELNLRHTNQPEAIRHLALASLVYAQSALGLHMTTQATQVTA
jgi:hypothetical protein